VRAGGGGEGRGGRCTVRLPLHPEPAPPGRPVRVRQAPEVLRGRHVLLVEDDRDTLESTKLLLELYGASVSAAASADEALRAVRARVPDLLVTDLGMPDVDGITLVERLREQHAVDGVPAVALTGHAGSEDRARVLRAGFAAHLGKPIDPERLVSVLATLARGDAVN